MIWHPKQFLVPCLAVSLVGAVVVRVWFTPVAVVQHVSRNLVNLVDRDVPDDWALDWKDLKGKVTQQARNIQWVQALGSKCNGGPVIAGGRIFVGSNNDAPRDPNIRGDMGVLMCFRQSDGKFLWQAVHDKLPNQIHDYPRQGVISHPAVEGDRLWYVSNRCELICADVADGSPVWRLDLFKNLGVRPHSVWHGPCGTAPLIIGDLVFAITGNGVDDSHMYIPAPEAPSFVAVNKHTGKVVWQDNAPTAAAIGASPRELKRLMDTGRVVTHGQWSSPAHAVVRGRSQVIFPGGDGWLRAYEPKTGELIWKFDTNPKDYRWQMNGGLRVRNAFVAMPVVVGDRLYIGTGEDPEHYEGEAHFWCINLTKTGDISPELVIDDAVFPPKTGPNPNSGAVWVYGGPTTPEDRKALGSDYYFGRTLSTAAVHDGLVYAAELSGYLHCLDAATGTCHWRYDLKSAVLSSPYWVDGKVYLGTDDGEVWIFEHSTVCKVIRKVAMDYTIHSNPVVADRGLYVATDRHLYAIAPKITGE